MTGQTPRQRWGTCCPFDPECDHSFIDTDTLAAHMDTPISDAEANRLAGIEDGDSSTTDVMRADAGRLADRIRAEADRAGTDTRWLDEVLTCARDCEKQVSDARLYVRLAIREADA